MSNTDISAETVRSLLDYDPFAGVLTWKETKGGRRRGSVAGWKEKDGYHRVSINGVSCLLHRVIWLVTGVAPVGEIDHRDTNRSNNRFGNLRDVEHSTNMENLRKAMPTNKSGFLGVTKNRKGWLASICVRGKKFHLGTHPTPEQAYLIYLETKRRVHAGCTL